MGQLSVGQLSHHLYYGCQYPTKWLFTVSNLTILLLYHWWLFLLVTSLHSLAQWSKLQCQKESKVLVNLEASGGSHQKLVSFINVQNQLILALVFFNHHVLHFDSFSKLYWINVAQIECWVICKYSQSFTNFTVQVQFSSLSMEEVWSFLDSLLKWGMGMVILNCLMKWTCWSSCTWSYKSWVAWGASCWACAGAPTRSCSTSWWCTTSPRSFVNKINRSGPKMLPASRRSGSDKDP